MTLNEPQIQALDRLEGAHPGTCFTIVGFEGEVACIEWDDLGGSGTFLLDTLGKVREP